MKDVVRVVTHVKNNFSSALAQSWSKLS